MLCNERLVPSSWVALSLQLSVLRCLLTALSKMKKWLIILATKTRSSSITIAKARSLHWLSVETTKSSQWWSRSNWWWKIRIVTSRSTLEASWRKISHLSQLSRARFKSLRMTMTHWLMRMRSSGSSVSMATNLARMWLVWLKSVKSSVLTWQTRLIRLRNF